MRKRKDDRPIQVVKPSGVTAQRADPVSKLARKAAEYHRRGKLDIAYSTYKKLLRWREGDPNLHNNLGLISMQKGLLQLAESHLTDALRINPDFPEALVNQALVAGEMGNYERAVTALKKAVELRANDPGTYNNLGNAYQNLGLLDEAVAAYRKALSLNSHYPKLRVNLAIALLRLGVLDEAFSYLQDESSRRPNDLRLLSQVIMTRNYLSVQSDSEFFDLHVRWGKKCDCEDSRIAYRHVVESPSDRRLRVGYVSPDFKTHSVANFLFGLFAEHDSAGMEVVCYSNVNREDEMTTRLKGVADLWCDIRGLGDEQVAQRIRRDKIDVLVDLSGHTAGGVLSVFALRPAPVQFTYLGYPNTTGLAAIDYRITDWLADPEGEESLHTEKLVRLPRCFMAYTPPSDAIGETVADTDPTRIVTFGSFNNVLKVNREVVAAWARILRRVPASRLMMKSRPFDSQSAVTRYASIFEQHGIDPARLDLLGFAPSQKEHLVCYRGVDIALDTFPYNGTTTTCEALWMGVPVVTVAGNRHRERVGVSLLTAVELSELVASDVDHYCECAIDLASDKERLWRLKSGLRKRVANSPLCDARTLAKELEKAYRDALVYCRQGRREATDD